MHHQDPIWRIAENQPARHAKEIVDREIKTLAALADRRMEGPGLRVDEMKHADSSKVPKGLVA